MPILGNIPVSSSDFISPGMMAHWPKQTSPPSGWLFCHGQSISRTTYAGLFAVIGTAFGSVDGSTFNLPDCRGRTLVSAHSMNGADASPARLTTNMTRASAGGSQTHALSNGEMGNHNHSCNTTGMNHGHLAYYIAITSLAYYAYAFGLRNNGSYPVTSSEAADINHTHSVDTQGSSSAHNNMQPYLCLSQIVKV